MTWSACLSVAALASILSLVPLTPARAATEITHNGVTWTLAEDDLVTGSFVCGEPWVVGPVTVVKIANSLNDPGFTPRDGQNGSMVNPLVGHDRGRQGYDDGLGSYAPELNAGRPGGKPLSADNPLALAPGRTLVSMVSWLYRSPDEREPGCPRINASAGGPRPVTRAAGVLTIVSEAPRAGSFRPPYAGADKTVAFNVDQLDKGKLLALAPPASMPPVAELEGYFARTWIDHVFEWLGGYVHPSDHMPNYGRDMARKTALVAMALQVDFDQLPGKPSKDVLLRRFVQYGIDCAGIADAGGGWRANGGHGLGRKWPILFAGVMLNDAHMKNVGHWPRDFGTGVEFQEDQQFFHVTEADVKLSHSDTWKPDHRNVKAATVLPYDDEHIGMAEWGIRHAYSPQEDNRHMAAVYRQINSGVMPAFALVARMMDQQRAWNHEPLFDYSDRYMAACDGGYKLNPRGGTNHMHRFLLDMWHAWAGRLPTIARYRGDRPGAFSLTCDDGRSRELEDAVAIFDPLGLKATFFVIPLFITNPKMADQVADWPRLRQLQADGHEIGTHGSVGRKLHEVDDAELEHLINDSWRLIKDNTGVAPISYATPGGSRPGPREVAKILEHHLVMRNQAPKGMKKFGYGNAGKRVWDDQAMRQKILAAADQGLWSYALIHAVVNGYSPFKSKQELRVHCEWLAGQRDKLWIAPLGEVGLYIQARQAAHLQIVDLADKHLSLRLTCELKPESIYRKTPLTVVVPAAGAENVKATDGRGSALEAVVREGRILVDVMPDGETVTLDWQ